MGPRQCFKGVNFMTPYPVRYGWIVPHHIAFEISEGTDLSPERKPIFGVSLRTRAGSIVEGGELVRSMAEANALIDELTEQYRNERPERERGVNTDARET